MPIEWYLEHREYMLPCLLSLNKYVLEEESLPASIRENIFVLIPKLNKGLYYYESYYSISLMNTDLKILATQLNSVVPSLTKSDQTGFIPGRSTYTHLRRPTYLQVPNTSDLSE